MSLHLQREIDRLRRHLLSLCALVEDQLQLAIRSLLERDADLARQVESRDDEVDQREIEVEEDCLKTLALYQPVATDLRLIVAAMKIDNDLERIGDMAVNIARKAEALAGEPPLAVQVDIAGMWGRTQSMLRDSINAMVKMDLALAHDVSRRDDDVDRFKREIRIAIEEAIKADPGRVRAYLRLLAVSRNLERTADLATNIAEDVIYLGEGRIARHIREEQ